MTETQILEAQIHHAKQMLAIDVKWASRAIVRLYQFQTRNEQDDKTTAEKNGRGFNSTDAEILSSFAERLNQGIPLTDKQLKIAFRALPKYARQLVKAGKE